MNYLIDNRPDAGDFVGGRLAWDILKWTARHRYVLPTSIDLWNCPHLKPYSIACLAALGARTNGTCPLRMPSEAGCSDHLTRLGLTRFFKTGTVASLPLRATNVPIEMMTTIPSNSFSTNAISIWANEVGGVPAGLQPDLENHLDEMIMNAITHSLSPIGCIVAGQAFPNVGKVEVAIVDLGQTIRGHLVQNPQYAWIPNDTTAIVEAVKLGVTGTPAGAKNRFGDANSGSGLAELSMFCSMGNGVLSILSGDTCVSFSSSGQHAQAIVERFEGTLVNVCFFTGINLQPTVSDAIFF